MALERPKCQPAGSDAAHGQRSIPSSDNAQAWAQGFPDLDFVKVLPLMSIPGNPVQTAIQNPDGVITRLHSEASLRLSGALVDPDEPFRDERRLNHMLPQIENHLRFGVPDADFYWNLPVPDRADDDNAGRCLCTVRNILFRPVFGRLLSGDPGVPDVKLVVFGEDSETPNGVVCS